MRLKDTDEIKNSIKILFDKRYSNADWYEDYRKACIDIGEIIDATPTIEAEPVTRCRDCKFYTEEERWCTRLGLCGAFYPNDYCSHAEEGTKEC